MVSYFVYIWVQQTIVLFNLFRPSQPVSAISPLNSQYFHVYVFSLFSVPPSFVL